MAASQRIAEPGTLGWPMKRRFTAPGSACWTGRLNFGSCEYNGSLSSSVLLGRLDKSVNNWRIIKHQHKYFFLTDMRAKTKRSKTHDTLIAVLFQPSCSIKETGGKLLSRLVPYNDTLNSNTNGDTHNAKLLWKKPVFRIQIRKFLSPQNPDPSVIKQKKEKPWFLPFIKLKSRVVWIRNE